jgi:hypothetical protein
MDLKSMALAMYPYWLLGAGVLAATAFAGFKNLIRVEKPALLNFIKFLGIITLYRVVIFTLFPHFGPFASSAHNVIQIPWPLTLTVFWEDACHGLPLLLLRKLIGTNKWTWPIHGLLTAIVMLEFGLGHVYQGLPAAAMLSLYIPYSIKLGEKFGFGTVMIGHTLFDLTTVLTLKCLLGA